MSFEEITERIKEAKRDILLVAVSKNQSPEKIMQLYQKGCRDFGESRVQEWRTKKELCPPDIKWHFIGKLQKNKVRHVIGECILIHSVDSLELAALIGEHSKKKGIETSILLEVNASGEKTKGGLSPERWKEIFVELSKIEGIQIKGLMTMAPLTEDEAIIRSTFAKVRKLKEELMLDELSMGMSNDFPIAIEEGATIVRIGHKLFEDL